MRTAREHDLTCTATAERRLRGLSLDGIVPYEGSRAIVELHTRTTGAVSDLLAGVLWVYRRPLRPVMHTEKTGHLAQHVIIPHR